MKKYLSVLILFVLSFLSVFAQPTPTAYKYMDQGISATIIRRPYYDPILQETVWEFSGDNILTQADNQLVWKFRSYNRDTDILTTTAYFFIREYQNGIPIDWWNSYVGFTSEDIWYPGLPFPSDPSPSSSDWFYNGSHPYYSRASVPFNRGSKIVTVGNSRYHITELSSMRIVNPTTQAYETDIAWISASGFPQTYSTICVPPGGIAQVLPKLTSGDWTYDWVGFSSIHSEYHTSCQ